jgi:thioesterase domain-containing protein
VKTHYGQLFHVWEFKKEIRRIHKSDPQARFVLIGFSFGANMAREVANEVRDDGIVIDLLVYLGGNTLENDQKTQPENVIHIVNILAVGCIWNGAQLDRAENMQYDNVLHFGSPTHPRTREMLMRELSVVASRVPFSDRTPPLSPQWEQEIPQPRRVTPEQMQQMSSQMSSEWTFLNPRSASTEPAAPEEARPVQRRTARRIPFTRLP